MQEKHKHSRRAPKMAKALFGLLLLILTGALYEKIAERRDLKRLPRIGQRIDIGGYQLNIFCSGGGDPPVIFDSGAQEPGYTWSGIQADVAKITRACWFDRAGFGWSDPGSYPRTSAMMSSELHKLLHNAGIRPPFVLVGHSLGGLNVRVYNGLYPDEVAGAVLVDAAHEDEPRRAPRFMLGKTAPPYLRHPLWTVTQAMRRIGVVRLMTRSAPLPEVPQQLTRDQILAALGRQPKTIATLFGDATSPESYAQAERSGGFGDRPLIVLTQGKSVMPLNPGERDTQYAAYLQIWMHEIQPKLVQLSTNGCQLIITRSGHNIPQEAPEAVTTAVVRLVNVIRNKQSAGNRNSMCENTVGDSSQAPDSRNTNTHPSEQP